jgi:hypothetical protein
MAAPPYINATGLVTKILDKIIEAAQPERFTQDFLATKLGFSGGSARPFIPLLKKLGFKGTDGTPSTIYSQFRNPDTRGAAMAQAMHIGYKDVYERNEFAHALTKDKFKNLIVEMTGLPPTDGIVSATVGTFFNLNSYADFDKKAPELQTTKKIDGLLQEEAHHDVVQHENRQKSSGLNLSYTINLNLPETSDVEVFNAIFRSLKEHLLKD